MLPKDFRPVGLGAVLMGRALDELHRQDLVDHPGHLADKKGKKKRQKVVLHYFPLTYLKNEFPLE